MKRPHEDDEAVLEEEPVAKQLHLETSDGNVVEVGHEELQLEETITQDEQPQAEIITTDGLVIFKTLVCYH